MDRVLNNRYKLIKIIGTGGMATVYLAHCNQLDRDVAIKALHPTEDELSREVFLRESKAIARLSHTNIVQVYDVFEEDGIQYIVMEYIYGDSLKKVLKQEAEPLEEKKVVEMGLMLAKALSHAHKQGVIHSDIKPDNIIVNEYLEPRITDFGIAKISLDGSDKTNQLYGSILYASPEQVTGRIIDMRTDIYSLGVVLFELMTKTLPYPIGLDEVRKFKENYLPIIHPSKSIPNISSEFANIIYKCMQARPQDRYQNMEELIEDLEKLAAPPIILEPVPEKKESRAFLLVMSVLLALATVLLVAIPLRSKLFKRTEITVPSLINMNYLEAKDRVNLLGLYLTVDEARFDNVVEKGVILEQTPLSGILYPNDTIRVTVSKGVEQTRIPELRNRKLSDVEEVLRANKLTLGVTLEEHSDEVVKGYIISQSIGHGTVVDAGTSVNVVVSMGKKPEMAVVPSLVGISLTDAKLQLDAHNLYIIEIQHEYSDQVQKNFIIRQSIPANTSVEKQTGIVVVVSDGPEFLPPGSPINFLFPLPLGESEEDSFTVKVVEVYDGETRVLYEQPHEKAEGNIQIQRESKIGASYQVLFNETVVGEGTVHE